jgi:hypothetical protein
MTTASVANMTGEEWRAANSRYLVAEMGRLRLLLRRRVLWLRRHWQREPAQNFLGWAITDQESDALLAGNDRQQELSFYETDLEAQNVASLLREMTEQIAVQRQEMEEAGAQAALDTLAARFGLTSFERDLILLCLAPELDPGFERLYAYIQDDATRKYATPYLAWSALANFESAESGRASLHPASPLRRWRLVTLEAVYSGGGWGGAPLRIDARMTDYLLGINRLDERCRGTVRGVPTQLLSAGQRDLATQLAAWLRTGRPGALQWINLAGPPDSGRLGIAQEVCAQTGRTLVILDSRLLQGRDLERNELVSLLERESVLLNLLFYLDADSSKPEETQELVEELQHFAAPLIIASRDRLRSGGEVLTVPVARPNTAEQVELWKQALGENGDAFSDDVEALAEQFDFGPEGVAQAVASAENQAVLRSGGDSGLTMQDLWQACRHQATPHVEQLAQRIVPCYEWDDIVVPPDILRQLQEITGQVAQRHLVYQSWGFGAKLNRGRGISALFSGVSGVGKTMAAEVMARHLKLDLYRIDLAGVVSKYIGETEKNLRSVFDAAERSGAILFFDEADALFGKRSEVKDSHDRYANIEVNYLLQRMEDYRGLAILATNMKSALDSAFMRRLRFIVDFPFPDAAQRHEIWRRVFPAAAAVRDLDFRVLAGLEIPGGNIRNIALNAAFLAAGAGTPITMDHVMRAARREYAKIDRLILDAEFGRYAGAKTL